MIFIYLVRVDIFSAVYLEIVHGCRQGDMLFPLTFRNARKIVNFDKRKLNEFQILS